MVDFSSGGGGLSIFLGAFSPFASLKKSELPFPCYTTSQNKMSWIAGTLEVASKVRYGLTTRGCPIFRFVPYDKRYAPFAVGSSIRDFSTNVHAIIEPSEGNTSMPKGSIVQLLGAPSARTEQAMLLMTYAYDSKKEFRTILPSASSLSLVSASEGNIREEVSGFTFHIDPPGCKDVDDAFTFAREGDGWRVHIHIADVDAWIKEDSPLDKQARKKASTFYSTDGQALAPLFPPTISEESASLLPGSKKPTLSLHFHWTPGTGPSDFVWACTTIQTQRSFTYDEADKEVEVVPELAALRELSKEIGDEFSATDSHTWVQALMILYNKAAGTLLRQKRIGILRRHSAKKMEKFQAIGLLSALPMAAAEYVMADEENVVHGGLSLEAYAYASSPIRRYCDLVNQRILKHVLAGKEVQAPTKELVAELNRRQKQEKAFTRDLFFMGVLTSKDPVQGIAMSEKRVWIPAWKRAITVRNTALTVGTSYTITWYENKQLPHWKQRIVFRAV